MARKFTLTKDYFEEGITLFKKSRIMLKPGVTVLVGCNGYGKTTLLNSIERQLQKQDIPCITYDNLKDGGGHAREQAGFRGDFEFLATSMCSSEGENICMNVRNLAQKIGRFVRNPNCRENMGLGDRLDAAIRQIAREENGEEPETEEKKPEIPKERWILLDAVDSGLSLDNIADIKDLFSLIMKDCRESGLDAYIVLSANSYGFAEDADCFDPYEGTYIRFPSYQEYQQFILETRKIKDARCK